MPGEPGPQVIRAGQDQGPGLVDGPGTFSRGAAPGDHQGPDRFHGAVPALGGAAGPAGLRGPGGADRIEGIGLALTAAVLPVGAGGLDDPDTRCGDITGQSGAVTAGPLDAGQGDGPETASQPSSRASPAAVAGNSLTPSSPPTGSSAAATWVSA